eukprot:gene3121-3322_t
MYNRNPAVVYSYFEEKQDASKPNLPELDQKIESPIQSRTINLLSDKELRASKRHLNYVANFWDVLSFGICVTMGNIFIAWGSGFSQGYWDFFFATAISSSCFLCLFFCIAEVVSIVPFGGGTYALARITVGPYIGFLVGACESIGNIIFTLVAMMPLGSGITYMFGGNPKYEPVYWLVLYVLMIATEFAGIITLYIVISAQNIDTSKYIPNLEHNTYSDGITELLPLLYPAGWWYFGIEIIPLISDEVENVKVSSPRAIVWTAVIVTVLAFVCMLLSYAQYPSYEDDYSLIVHVLPLSSGFSNAFGINDQMASLLSYPGLYIANALFVYGYGKQLSALAKSRLLPSFFGWTLKGSNIPYMALLLGSIIGYAVLIILSQGLGYDYDSELTNELFNASLMGSYFTFEVMFASFLMFRFKYKNIARSYTSPLGIYGAIYGMLGFGFLFASAVVFANDDYRTFLFFIGFIVISSIYYFLYAKYTQIFSEDEQAVMFTVYLLKANERKLSGKKFVHPQKPKNRRSALHSKVLSVAETTPINEDLERGKSGSQHRLGTQTGSDMAETERGLECYQELSMPVIKTEKIIEEPDNSVIDWGSASASVSQKKKNVQFILPS